MFVGDLCEENKASIEDDSTYIKHVSFIYSQLNIVPL
ncbi:hypothetical protein MBCUT_20020 [Methanobrevibacter cuticularis]|uniref:Uncharacterized protein n=1 Tax=Methanobrevibacter cuticularis TaxID=47311 RepID=A0A166CKQ0_9EURY|nr:hypothetical protein MBCUT_20020 [Methanobrevibacter cuticularis]